MEVSTFIFFIVKGKVTALRIEQQSSWDVASELATQLQYFETNKFSRTEFQEILQNFKLLNPNANFYLLDRSGNIIYTNVDTLKLELKSVSLLPILRSLEVEAPDLPYFGDNPLNRSEHSIFSVAEVRIGGEPGYVYLTFRSNMADFLSTFSAALNLLRLMYPGIAGFALLAMVIGGFFTVYLLRHLRLILRSLRQFEKGNFDIRPNISSGDEMELLCHTVNQMADAIVERQEQLEQINKKRRDLVSNIAHDLRGLLTSVTGSLEMITTRHELLTPEERNQYLEIVLRGSDLEAELVENLHELSNLDAKEQAPQMKPFSLSQTVQYLSGALEQDARIKGLHLELNGLVDIPDVIGDKLMISRVITNLVGNAIRYTPSGGRVLLTLTREPTGVCVEIADTGIGIGEADLPHIFEGFYRAHKGHHEDPGGTGLGLAIVKRILELHGSTITVNSVVNEGTVFTFSLKIAMESLACSD